MTIIFALLSFLQFAFRNIEVRAIPQDPQINYPVIPPAPPYPNTTVSITTSYESPSVSTSSLYEMSYTYPSVIYTPQSMFPQTTYSYSPQEYAGEYTSPNTYSSTQYGTYPYYPTSTPSMSNTTLYPPNAYTPTYSQYTSSYPQEYQGYPQSNLTSPVYFLPICHSNHCIEVLNPGAFELWSYAPGICDLDNKPVSSSVSPLSHSQLTWQDQLSFYWRSNIIPLCR